MNPQQTPPSNLPPNYQPPQMPHSPVQGQDAAQGHPQGQSGYMSQNDYKLKYERPKATGSHPMVVLQDGEVIVTNIKRHPFGIVSLYFAAAVGIAVVAVISFLMMPDMIAQFSGDNSGMMLGVGIVSSIVVLLLLVLGVATSVYWQNEWVVTTDSITQITQNSLFGRQVSQLSMDNLEDVTVDQHGIIPHMFNFGTLKVQSAGERSKFAFPYCPRPNEYARQILEVHEHFLEERRNTQQYQHYGHHASSTMHPGHGGPGHQPQQPFSQS
jgi:hypothetical protein